MLKAIMEWSARHVGAVLFATAVLVGGGIWSVVNTPLDALPDLSDVQVIVYTEFPGQGPNVVEDQVTFPLSTAMLSVPRARVVRGVSNFGVSFVYVIFEDGTDIYWARSRVLEYLSTVSGKLPAGVTPSLGPDATGVGWVYQYVVQGAGHSLDELRALQDWYLRFQITKAPGVAEVASVGGFVRTWQVTVDPRRLQAYGIALRQVSDAIRASNHDVGGRSLELAGTEYMIRGRGYLRSLGDLDEVVLRAGNGTAVRVREVARSEFVPDERRGLAELDGEGEVVAGIAIARYGQNAMQVIGGIKDKLRELAAGLPAGVTVKAVYDRSGLIQRAIATLRHTLLEESLIVAAVCLLFLAHLRSALVAIVMLPVGVLMAFIAMHALGFNSNIMSLGGIAIAVGAMVDAAIVMIENTHKHLERLGEGEPRLPAIIAACREVGPALFFSLLVITVSFIPVFTLEAQEGRLFQPLAFTKTFAMGSAALLSVTLVPALMVLFVRGRIPREQANPLVRGLMWAYRPAIAWVLRWPKATIGAALLLLALAVVPALRIGTEFMPTLNEGTLLFMPSSLPGMSVTQAARTLQQQDRILKAFPEVESVFGKAGRAGTATDPAPLEMSETVINLKPEAQWRADMTIDTLVAEMDEAVRMPGVSNAWTMPIKARIDMLATGIRTPVGIKVFGNDLAVMDRVARQVEQAVRAVPGTTSAYAERLTGGFYLDIVPDRVALARYGLTIDDVHEVIATALGAQPVTTTVEGRQRFDVTVRYPRELRDDPQAIGRNVLVALPAGGMLPLAQLAALRVVQGPPGIRTENGLLSAYVFVDMRGRDLGGYVADAQRAVAARVQLPPGTYLAWSGQYEYLQHAIARLKIVIPVTLLVIATLLYLNFRRIGPVLLVMLSVPFALVGGVWLIWLLGYNLSVAVVVGFIALAGVAAETAVVMLIYLDNAWAGMRARCAALGRLPTHAELNEALMQGAVLRLRPKMMTVLAIMAGLLPIMWGTGTGSEVMRRIAAPMVGGMVSATLLTLLVVPALYLIMKQSALRRAGQAGMIATAEANDTGATT
jgi:Cu(I)/Ag(I) efflux system membrane protein CusA/SilA